MLISSRYQFNADLYNPDVVVNILVKALASVPFPDFNLSVALLDDRSSSANMDEPDPLPALLPYLVNMHSLLQQCRFPAFWALYRSDALESLRDNYTVEVVGFEDSIREVAVRAVKATFQRIGSTRLGSYLDLEGDLTLRLLDMPPKLIRILGEELEEYIARLRWKFDSATGVVEVPPNPDNQIASTVVQEDIKLQRKFLSSLLPHLLTASNRINKSHITRYLGSVGFVNQKGSAMISSIH